MINLHALDISSDIIAQLDEQAAMLQAATYKNTNRDEMDAIEFALAKNQNCRLAQEMVVKQLNTILK